MTITNEQIVLAESQVMADTEDGGGRMSGNVVEDGAVNNTMPDISRLDRVYGRVNLRKLFLSVRAANQDTLLGSHSILLREPLDPRVIVTLFKTGSHIDRRENARDRIESYVVKSTEANFWLWGDQLQSQRGLSALQRLDATPPEQGEIYAIVSADTLTEQYVRITEVEVGRQTFTVEQGSGYIDFELQTLQLTLANELKSDFLGSEPRPTGKQSGKARILRTQVADAARYYGAKKLSVSAEPGDLVAQVESVYNNLVPSAQSEIALSDKSAGPARVPVVAATVTPISVNAPNATLNGDSYAVYYLGRGVVPGTLNITGSNGNYSDEGGKLAHVSGSNYLDASTIDYQAGIVKIKYTTSRHAQSVDFSFIPGAAFFQQSYCKSVAVELQTRSLTYVNQLRPISAPATLIIEYRALGRWATLADGGDGILRGDGTGRINYATGTCELTLAGLPDVGTEIIYSWGDNDSFDIESGSVNSPQAYFKMPFSGTI